ncbi:DUF445 domain-containing protein [uncultured Megamonas sp.]|uniref:DUF445 domain-containing protein n=1 Tax=uncultured Megamonas sp. TaxID=286140 RepID=UPI0025CF0A8D|nr:DUF445 domain-containing protein [uncultured Megamonas sp.]
MDRFNKADKTLCVLFICFLVVLALKTLYPQYIIFELLLFCSEASLVGGIADWFAVTALFKKPLGFPFHTAILPRRRNAFINSCVKMLQTEFLSKRKIYRRICNADLLSWGLKWIKKPENKQYVLNEVMHFLLQKISEVDASKVAAKNSEKLAQIILKESMNNLSNKLIDILLKSENSQLAVDKSINLLKGYFAGRDGKAKIDAFIENYQKQYGSGLGGLMLSLALATNALDPEELSLIIHERILTLLEEVSDKDSELYANFIDLYESILKGIREDENWINSLENLRDNFVDMGVVQKIVQNSIRNVCEYLLASGNKSNKLYQTIEHIFAEEIDRCIEKLNTNNEFKSKINRFVLDVVHRSALKGEDVILELARKFLEGLTDKQLNELVYDKVETDMIWIRLNGSIVGGIIGFFAFWVLQLVNN